LATVYRQPAAKRSALGTILVAGTLAALLAILIHAALILAAFATFLLLLAAFTVLIAHILAIVAALVLLICHSASSSQFACD
jgi:hypothetical protein